MNKHQDLIRKLGVVLSSAFFMTQMGCHHLPHPPGLPGLPRPPGLPHGELRDPVKQREDKAVVDAQEAERLDRIRNLSKYQGR
jgi:hypothetical protein